MDKFIYGFVMAGYKTGKITIPEYKPSVGNTNAKITFTGNNTQFNKNGKLYKLNHSKHVAKTGIAVNANLYIAVVNTMATQRRVKKRLSINTGQAFINAAMVSNLMTAVN